MIDTSAIRQRFAAVAEDLNERSRRLLAAAEAKTAGRGGIAAASRATGIARSTIGRGLKDLAAPEGLPGAVRRPGGGCPTLVDKDPTLLEDLRRLVEPATMGDPMRPLMWVSKSHAKLAAALREMGHKIADSSIPKLLSLLDYRRQVNRKTLEGRHNPDRNAQFEHINAVVSATQAAGQPVISIDTKKKELIGAYKNGGSDYRPEGCPDKVKFARLGIQVVAQTDANFDAAKQKKDVETVMAKKPSAIFSELVDPDTAPEAFKPAKEAGAVLVFVDQPPKDFKAGKEYVSVVSDDFAQMGKHAGDAMAAALGDKGKIAYVYHNANFFVTNQRDSAFKQTILDDHKGVQIVSEQGLVDPTRAEDVLNALVTKHPDLDGVYATWSTPAESVLAALRNAGNKHTRIVTFDLSEPLAVDMVKGGNVAAIVVDQAYLIGQTGAKAVGLGLIGEKAAPYYAVDALTVTKDSIEKGYENSLHRRPPESLTGK